jgi:hypothetical protein
VKGQRELVSMLTCEEDFQQIARKVQRCRPRRSLEEWTRVEVSSWVNMERRLSRGVLPGSLP